MGHISYFKGVDTLLEAYEILKLEIDNLDLVIANNMVRGDQELLNEVKKLQEKYPSNIIIKGVIDPIEELSKAWVYIYPFIKPGGTMSFALSLYESQECHTPYVACDIGANAEFFDISSLIQPNNTLEMVNKIKEKLLNAN
jgi:glycosyltransferase involved in cell wall biosynthesis